MSYSIQLGVNLTGCCKLGISPDELMEVTTA
jgi:hypothetical protein